MLVKVFEDALADTIVFKTQLALKPTVVIDAVARQTEKGEEEGDHYVANAHQHQQTAQQQRDHQLETDDTQRGRFFTEARPKG